MSTTRWKHWLRYPLDIRTARRALRRAAGSRDWQGQETIGIDLSGDDLLFDCARHLACLAAHARQSGRGLVLRCSRQLLAAVAHKRLGQWFLSLENVRWLSPADAFPQQALVFADHFSTATGGVSGACGVGCQRTAVMCVGAEALPGQVVMPYPMHPRQILSLDRPRLEALRGQPKAGVFFAGNQKPRYGRDSMRANFGVLSRLEVLDHLRRHFPERIAEREAFARPDRIVLRDSGQHPIAAADWMPTLARHRFFLCCPGVSQPLCHNAVEAMAVGTIPVLEYAGRFSPALQDGVTAICFSGREGLSQAIERIDRMSPAACQAMSRRVAEHFDRSLCGVRFLNELSAQVRAGQSIALSMPFHERSLTATRTWQASAAGRRRAPSVARAA